MNAEQIVMMTVPDLEFDHKNPRLAEFDITDKSTESEVIQILCDAMDVEELVMSIAASGFFPHEPVIVSNEGKRNVVIEGNRRLAAVKLLLDPNLAKELEVDVPVINSGDKEALKAVPGIFGTRKDAWRYLGFKHVNGPAKWSSYAKSRYIAEVHREYDVSLDDIARQIGDTHKTVQRLFRGLMVIEQAERLGAFNRDDRWRKHFSFSHLYTGLDYPGISSFIGLRSADENSQEPVPHEKKKKLRELCIWIYGSKKDDRPPVVEKQNPHLRQLNAVLENREALATLRDNNGLASAYELTRESSTVFEEALTASKRNLQKARGILSTGYDGSEDLLRIASTVADLADDLYDEMERKCNPRRRKKRISENG